MLAATGENSIPMSPLNIAEKLGFHVIPYGELGKDGEKACLKYNPNGFKLARNGIWYIYFNAKTPKGRARFTLLHEIGHIVLGHLQESDIAEAEANFFAKFLIAPPVLINAINPNDYLDVAKAFGLSNEAALNSWSYYKKWLGISHEKDYEAKLKSLFFIQKERREESIEYPLRTKRGGLENALSKPLPERPSALLDICAL